MAVIVLHISACQQNIMRGVSTQHDGRFEA